MEECDAAYAHCGGDTCGTIAGLTCSGSEWCDYPDGSYCGGDDSGGVCRPRPMACADIWAPVCACDGSTYGNECSAHAAGQDVVSTGECETTPATDCRTTGCPMGQHCDACLAAGGVEYACIPDGAAC
jgi:hypothetical protein